MGWPHMHREKPQVVGGDRSNLVRSVKEKKLKIILKDGMIEWAKIQTSKFEPMQDLSQVQ